MTDKRGFGSKWGSDGSALRLVNGIKKAVEASDPFDGIKAFEYCNNGDTRALEVLKDYTDTIAMGLLISRQQLILIVLR